MDNCTYDKTRLMHEIGIIMGFIEKHAKLDAKAAKHSGCENIYQELYKDLSKHLKQLQSAIAKCEF